jgi:hypothetical protein
MPVMLIETETTPNPATLKFLPGRTVMDAGTRDFATPEEAEASPLAEALFDLGDVTGVFFGRDFVSVTAAPGVDWRELKRMCSRCCSTISRPPCRCSARRRPGSACRPRKALPMIPPTPTSSRRSRS